MSQSKGSEISVGPSYHQLTVKAVHEVTMPSTRALSKRDIERGYVLAGQAHHSSSTPIWLDSDI
ncbi:MAG: hypothetical protein GY896_17080 [Gammaproteobacteria bacterium]|nr:hypothetical protein [Gammaproteobacteria bacterium]